MRKLLPTRSWRTYVFSLAGLTVGLLSTVNVSAQCAFQANQWPTGTVAVTTTPGNTTTVNSCNYAGEHAVLSGMQAYHEYTLDITGLSPGYITVFDASNAVVTSGPAPLLFMPTVSADYKTQWNVDGTGCGTDMDCHTTTVLYNGPVVPATPPTPVQDPGTPDCITGSDLTVSGSPAGVEEWYWQTSATGTSLATPFTGTYTVYANGTYYLRAVNNVSMVWSAASSVTVSNFAVAATPPAPVPDANPACMTTNISMSAPPAGVEYYWQTTAGGTSSASSAATPQVVNATGTYYVAAYETTSQCWSETSSVDVTIGTVMVGAPTTSNDNINVCTGSGSVPLDAETVMTAGSTELILANNYTIAAGATDAINGTLTLPPGAVITSAQLSFTGVTVGGGSWPSDIDVDMTGVTNLGIAQLAPVNTGVTNAGPYNHAPVVSGSGAFTLNINHTYAFGGPGTFNQVTLTVNYDYVPASTITWYDAATGGNVLGTGSPFEAVGTSVLPNTSTVGAYSFFAASDVDGCISPTTEIVVNTTPVLAELTPIDVTCNGSANGSFSLGTVACGSTPFTYSVDGGAFGAIPTNLVAGTYSIVIQDALSEQSAPITLVITEPGEPMNLTVDNVNYYSADVSWTPQGDESTWTVEYGPTGFTLGTGMTVTASTNSANLPNLTVGTAYEFYVTADCGGTVADTAGPVAFATNPGFFTYDNECPAGGFIDIAATGTNLNLTDDSEAGLTMPIDFTYQGDVITELTVGNNGGLQLGTLTGNVGYGGNMTTLADGFIFPWGDDLDDETGDVLWEVFGTAPNRTFVVQWNMSNNYNNGAGTVTFQVQFDEATNEIYFVYDDVLFGGSETADDYAGNADIGISGPMTDINVSNNNMTYLQNNSCVHFYYALCPNPTNLVATESQEQIDLDWDAGLYGETTWTVIYGEEGFDPLTQGVTIGGLSSSDVSIPGLTQLTTYDFYIYSECQADNLTSDGLLGTFTTLPWCSAPTGISGTTDVDSLEVEWLWTESTPGYPVQSFNIQYAMLGNDLYSPNSTTVLANGVNFSDTVVDAALLPGGVYTVYVQAVCTTGDTSNFAGPITVVMPLTNDIVCDAAELMADGTNYAFNNAGATVSTDENTIAPPATGAQTTDGWANSTLNGTTWFTFDAPASGSVRINNTAINYNGQVAVYATTDCNSFAAFTLINANDNEINGANLAPNFTVCGLTPGNTYYLMHDGFNATTGNYAISIAPINLEAGTPATVVDVCSGDNVDLFATLTGNDAGGTWSSQVPAVSIGINGSDFESEGLGYQVFDFEYRVIDGCAYDSVITQVHIYGPSSAGVNGIIEACQNQPINLLTGLSGTIDLGGTWTGPNSTAIPGGDFTTGTLPGQFNYMYITSNGVCPNDTSHVIVNVSPACDYTGIQEQVFDGVSLYPNPSNGLIYVSSDSGSEFEFVVTDARGSLIRTGGVIKAAQTTEIDLNNVITGVYFVRLFNDEAEKVYRVVVQ